MGLDLNNGKSLGVFFYVHFLTRRLLLGVFLLVPFAQSQLVSVSSLALMYFIAKYKPFATEQLNQLELYNEFIIYVAANLALV